MKTTVQLAASSIFGLVLVGLLLFVPAGTLNYWQAWVFIGVFTAATIIPSVYLARTNPAALQRRMRGGPLAEGRAIQKVVIIFAFLDLFAMVVLSVIDHRMGWSSVPAWLCLVGDVLIAAGIGFAMLVIIQNNYAAATVRVETGQSVASTGVYKFVRHPIYLSFLLAFWSTPTMTAGHLLFAVATTGYILIAIQLEERDLVDIFGDQYHSYRQQVAMLIPWSGRKFVDTTEARTSIPERNPPR